VVIIYQSIHIQEIIVNHRNEGTAAVIGLMALSVALVVMLVA
jgi:hypothetical protein